MAGISHVSLELLAFFLLVVIVLLGSSFYVLWWKRTFRRRLAWSAPPSDFSAEPCKSPSKELLYFLWLRGHSRVDPACAPELKLPECEIEMGLSSPAPSSVEPEGEFQQLYDRARLLYTIDEVKETETESEGELSFRFFREVSAVAETEVALAVAMEAGEMEDGEGRFFTPCSSPPFYTPMSSPSRVLDVSAGDHVHFKGLPVTEEVNFPAARISVYLEEAVGGGSSPEERPFSAYG